MKKEHLVLGGLFTLIIACILLAAFHASPRNWLGKSDPLTTGSGIAVVYLTQEISFDEESPLSEGAGAFIDRLKELVDDSRVKALVVRVNSPGGTVGASQEIHSQLKAFKAKTKVPVIVSIGDIGASGAYWVSTAADRIFANPGSMVGSIGVILNTYDFTEVQKRYGIGMMTYKSVAHKDLLSSWRKATPEEKGIISAMMGDIQAQFVETVSTGRHLSPEKTAALADGRIFTGRQALEVGLIDQLGSLDDAIHYAAQKAHIKGEPELIIEEPRTPLQLLRNLLRSSAHGFPQRIQLEFSQGSTLR